MGQLAEAQALLQLTGAWLGKSDFELGFLFSDPELAVSVPL